MTGEWFYDMLKLLGQSKGGSIFRYGTAAGEGRKMAMWNPWRGCHRHSEGCRFCYIHKGDAKRGVDTDRIVKTDEFYAPTVRRKNGEYKIKPGS